MKGDAGYVLEIKDLYYSVNQVEILKGINLKVKKGEFIGFIGPNGAGKTTLLKCINGLNKPKGSITVNGIALNAADAKMTAREAAMMHQNTAVAFPFPALELVVMGRYPHLKRFRSESREDYKIARDFMEFTDTLRFEKSPVTQLSGGERQRVLFAKVLAQKTGLILLDEPTASLDITYQEQIFKYCMELCSSGKTVIAAVHDLKTASRYCSRLILLKEGTILADGSSEEVLTSSNLAEAYGVNALVFRNRVTGHLDFYIHGIDRGKPRRRVHVIGGGGSASGVLRQLFEDGCEVTSGVFAHGDSDIHSAEIFGVRYLACKPFSEIDQDSFSENKRYITQADISILCNMPFGSQNIRNLEAAAFSSRLVIIEDDPVKSRDFTGGRAEELYNALRNKAVVTTSARLHEVL
jgi:iron complex transport system ATP-binding protein